MTYSLDRPLQLSSHVFRKADALLQCPRLQDAVHDFRHIPHLNLLGHVLTIGTCGQDFNPYFCAITQTSGNFNNTLDSSSSSRINSAIISSASLCVTIPFATAAGPVASAESR